MKLSELIERLEEIRDSRNGDDDPEVRLAFQPHYPLAFAVSGVTSSEEIAEVEGDDEDEVDEDELSQGEQEERFLARKKKDDAESIVWIACGDHPRTGSPYAPRAAWEVCS